MFCAIPYVLCRNVMFCHSLYQFDPNPFTTLQTPTLLLLGGDSPPLFERAIQRLDTTLPNSRVVILPGQQHVAMDTSPELFVSEVLNFLLVRG